MILFYSKMRWELKGMNFDQLWELEGEEARAAVRSIEDGIVTHLYKVCAEQYVISIGGSPTIEDFDRYAMGILPMREHLIFEDIWSLEEGFTIDVFDYLRKRRNRMADEPKFLYYIQMAWEPQKRIVDETWNNVKEELKDCSAGKVLGVYRVAGQQRIVSIVDVTTADELNSFGSLPVLKSPSVEKVWALRDYLGFADDVWKKYKFD